MTGKYRHEMKFFISYWDYFILRPRLRSIMQSDPHTDERGLYRIHSIYFDNHNDKALREKADGVQAREKYRIRWYNESTDLLTLEKKMKINDLCKKFGERITNAEFDKIMKGDYSWMPESGRGLLQEFYYRLQGQRLKPSVQISYVREPYIYEYGNVRLTFDCEVKCSLKGHDFNYVSPLVPTTEEIIMEVKYDEFLPSIISDILQIGCIRQNAFSKYMACRKYG